MSQQFEKRSLLTAIPCRSKGELDELGYRYVDEKHFPKGVYSNNVFLIVPIEESYFSDSNTKYVGLFGIKAKDRESAEFMKSFDCWLGVEDIIFPERCGVKYFNDTVNFFRTSTHTPCARAVHDILACFKNHFDDIRKYLKAKFFTGELTIGDIKEGNFVHHARIKKENIPSFIKSITEAEIMSSAELLKMLQENRKTIEDYIIIMSGNHF
jgi:hypothetical protein